MIIDRWTLFGFLGNLLFTTRVLIQWISSEKAGKSVAPPTFWWFSLAGAIVMIVYSVERIFDVKFQENPTPLPLLIGFIVTIVPYVRNLMLCYEISKKWHILSYVFAALIFSFCAVILLQMDIPLVRTKWIVVGTIGSIIWYTRFLWQWVYAEKGRKSEFPISFWYLSLIGLVLNLIYSIVMQDLVFILSFIFNLIPIGRNIMLMKKNRNLGYDL